MICSTLERNDGIGLRRQLYLTLICPLFSGQRAGEEHRGGGQLERGRAHRLGQEERGPILPAPRRRSAESQVGLCAAGEQRLDERGSSDWLSLAAQVGLPLLRPRGRVRPDGEAQAGHRQAEVSAAPPTVNSRAPAAAHRFLVRPLTSLHSLSAVTRCKESESPHAVTVYMLEPQTCQYVLGVSSAKAENDGRFQGRVSGKMSVLNSSFGIWNISAD